MTGGGGGHMASPRQCWEGSARTSPKWHVSAAQQQEAVPVEGHRPALWRGALWRGKDNHIGQKRGLGVWRRLPQRVPASQSSPVGSRDSAAHTERNIDLTTSELKRPWIL